MARKPKKPKNVKRTEQTLFYIVDSNGSVFNVPLHAYLVGATNHPMVNSSLVCKVAHKRFEFDSFTCVLIDNQMNPRPQHESHFHSFPARSDI